MNIKNKGKGTFMTDGFSDISVADIGNSFVEV